MKHIEELLEELGPDEAEAEGAAVDGEDDESWETDEEEMDQN